VRIGLLGPLAVQDDAGRAVRVGGARVRALLIVLALDAGHVVPAYALIDRLWGDDASSRPADAANALQSLVSRLRAALRAAGLDPGLIESSPVGYRLAIDPQQVDATAFERQARAGAQALAAGDAAQAASTLGEALALWRGPALADVADEEFGAPAAARLEEARRTARLDRIEADILLGDAARVTAELKAITTEDPYTERLRALLMRSLAASGRQADALAAYHEYRELLADQLGIDPSPAVEQVYLEILRQEPAVPKTLGRPPASALNSFVGRDDDTSGVLAKLDEHRLLTLTGPGGVGKTRLAAEVSGRLGMPAWFAELAPVTDPSQVPYAALGAVGIHERVIARQGGGGNPLDRLTDTLGDREAVLVLDNCEHVIDAAAELASRVLADCPKVKVLATSREPLRITGEALWPVAPLRVPSQEDRAIGVVLDYGAVRLLRDRVAAAVPGFEVTAGNAAAVARVCRALDGMPLAIELAAPWLRTLTPQQLAARLDDRFALLTEGSRTALPRHQTLRAVVDWSWDLLSPGERALARRLAAFPSGATLEAAEATCAGPGLPRAAVLPTLSGLVSKSILMRQEMPTGTRYRMLETVRAYGLEQLAEAGEDSVRDAVTRYYLDLAEAADPQLRTSEQLTWYHLLVAEQDNMHAALRWAISRGDGETALRMVRALSFYWVQLGHGEGDALARDTLALPFSGAQSLEVAEARVICALIAAGWSWDVEVIRGALNEALAELRRWAPSLAAIHPLAALAEPMMALFDGDQELALTAFEQYLSSPDPWMRAMARLYRSSYTSTLGRLGGSVEEDCRVALAEFRALGDKWGRAIALAQLAEFTELRGDHDASIAVLEEARELGHELGAWGDMPYIEGRLATVRARAGDLDGARAEWAAVERTAAEVSLAAESRRWLDLMRAEIAWHSGDMGEVLRSCASVLEDVKNMRAAWWQGLRAQVKSREAMVALVSGDAGRSRALLGEALQAATGWVERPPMATVIDATAAYVVGSDTPSSPLNMVASSGAPPSLDTPATSATELAAILLGAAHAVRGAFDESSPDAPGVRAAARSRLGRAEFEAAYQRGRDLSMEQAIALAGEVLALRAMLP
jgi:predicted ATPase/DNA-binding SARP family transcriptional activator